MKTLTEARPTSVQAEVEFYCQLTAARLAGYRSPVGQSLAERIVKTLLSQAEKTKWTEAATAEFTATVNSLVCQGQPIIITLAATVGLRAPNPLKFLNVTHLPHLGWLHLFWFFKFLDEKVKLIYSPGIRVVLFDESPIMSPLLGVSDSECQQCIAVSEDLIDQLDAPIEVRPMIRTDFPTQVSLAGSQVTEGQIYSFLCGMSSLQDRTIMDIQYETRPKDFAQIREQVGTLWDESRAMAERFGTCMQHRKDAGLFAKWLGTEVFVDATLTCKPDRLVFRPTQTMMHHGMPVVRRGEHGLYKMTIMPEYRIGEDVNPVCLCARELGLASDRTIVFYYESPEFK